MSRSSSNESANRHVPPQLAALAEHHADLGRRGVPLLLPRCSRRSRTQLPPSGARMPLMNFDGCGSCPRRWGRCSRRSRRRQSEKETSFNACTVSYSLWNRAFAACTEARFPAGDAAKALLMLDRVIIPAPPSLLRSNLFLHSKTAGISA